MQEDLSSEFEFEPNTSDGARKRQKLDDLVPSKRLSDSKVSGEERKILKWKESEFRTIDPYTRHKLLVNEYFLNYPGATKLFKRDTSQDKTDFDIIKQHHKFLWSETEESKSWGVRLAKRYYDKLFKEYCVADLTYYKEKKIALRWRTETEVVSGKGQFICGSKKCDLTTDLTSWEVNFGYMEAGQKMNALVKLRLCVDCSKRLNYHKRKNVIAVRSKKGNVESCVDDESNSVPRSSILADNITSNSFESSDQVTSTSSETSIDNTVWSKPVKIEETNREDEFTKFLEDILV